MSNVTGHQLIAAERRRQIESEGWSPVHDDQIGVAALETAAFCYRNAVGEESAKPSQWSLSGEWWKPKSRQRNLERAGALYLAAADTAERAEDYQRRDALRDHTASCAVLLDSIIARIPPQD